MISTVDDAKGPAGLHASTYDVFLSVCGSDRTAGRLVAKELRGLGLRVFLDEDDIAPFTGISESIWSALSSSKCLLAYYSAEYAVRPACQRELTAAFLAGQREGSPIGRVLVINPEVDSRHLRPVEVADAKFAVPSLGFAEIAELVAEHAATNDRPIGEVRPVRPPRLPARLSGHVRDLIGRYAELWDLHTALFGTDYPLIEESACGPFASVHGLPGAGKTALVAAYAWRFAAAFPGGVRWLTLAGPDADSELRSLRQHSATAEGDTLWVIDDIPDDVDASVLLEALPETGARTVLISDGDLFRDELPRILVGSLPDADGAALLRRYREPDSELDAAALDDLVDLLGGNPGALVAAGRYLRDRQGVASYSSIVDAVRRRQPVTAMLSGRVRRLLDGLSPAERTLLRLVGERGGGTFPASCLAAMGQAGDSDVTDILATVLHRAAAERVGSEWTFDRLIVNASLWLDGRE